MKILLLGGTRFLGRHLAEQALAAGHELTLLHRGRSASGLFPEARHLIADRDGELALLRGGERWDLVIDTSAYVPRQVRAVAAALSGRVERYQLVSTISVYAESAAERVVEDAPLVELDDPGTEQVTGATYGGLKVLCERAALDEGAGFGAARCLVVRPGLIVGPHDPTGRFSWWVQRLQRAAVDAHESELLLPGPPATALQFIDVRDLAAWMLRNAAASGVFNLTGPSQPLSLGAFFERARACLAPAAQLLWADGAWLVAQGVQPWSELPLWTGPGDDSLHRCAIDRALASGLHTRPLEDTLRDTAAWLASKPPPPAPGAMARPAVGLAPEREAALRAAWRAAPASRSGG